MATWETTVTNGAVWLNGKLDNGFLGIVKISISGDTLKVGDSVVVTASNGIVNRGYVFKGTLTVEGVEYPVVSSSAAGSILFAVGLPRDAEGVPQNISESDLSKENFIICFFPGTLIATPSGERKVEELASGDPVLIGDSGAIPATWLGRKFARAVSVKWIGRQTVSTLFGAAERLMPVRFAAGSLGGGGATSSAA